MEDLGKLPQTALMIVVLIVMIAIGATLLSQIKDSSGIVVTSNSVVNETFTNVVKFGTNTFTYYPVTSIVQIVNTSNGVLVPTANYTLGAAGTTWNLSGKVTVLQGEWNNTNLSVSYLYNKNVNNEVGNVTDKGLDAMTQYSNWFTILVIIIIMAVIIGLLLRSFLSGKTMGA